MATVFDSIQIPTVSLQNINNILDNGGFEVWQRGNSFTATGGSPYTADRWFYNANGAQTINITQESSVIDSGSYSIKVVATNAASNAVNIVQSIENKQAYYGKTISLSVRVKTTTPGIIQVGFYTGVGANYVWSNAHSGSGNWETLTVSGTLAASFAPSWNVYIGAVNFAAPNGTTFYADSAMLVIGSNPVNFVPTNPQQELDRCMRFFQTQTILQNNYAMGFWSQAETAAHVTGCANRFVVPMRTSPTITITNSSFIYVSNSAGGSIPTTSFNISAYPDGLGLGYQWSANVASGLSAGQLSLLLATGGSFTLSFSADL